MLVQENSQIIVIIYQANIPRSELKEDRFRVKSSWSDESSQSTFSQGTLRNLFINCDLIGDFCRAPPDVCDLTPRALCINIVMRADWETTSSNLQSRKSMFWMQCLIECSRWDMSSICMATDSILPVYKYRQSIKLIEFSYNSALPYSSNNDSQMWGKLGNLFKYFII